MTSIYLLEGGVAATTIDQNIAAWFNNISVNGWNIGNLILCIIALLLSVLLCGLVGLERERRGRSAGLRTHLLVGVGSAIIMIISIYGFPAGTNRDVARLAAQVVAGVGFLGAGAIIHSHGGSGIKGLTTASTIWLVMAIGLACGSMNFILAIFGTAIVMIVLTVFRRLERMVTRSNPLFIVLAKSDSPVLTEVLKVAKEFECEVSDLTSQLIDDGDEKKLEVSFKLSRHEGKKVDSNLITEVLTRRTNALSIQVLNHH